MFGIHRMAVLGREVVLWLGIACLLSIMRPSATSQEPLLSIDRGLVLYMPLDGNVSDVMGRYHGQSEGKNPLAFTKRSLFDSRGFGESLRLEGQRQWIESGSGIDLVPLDEGFTISLWINPSTLVGLVPVPPDEIVTPNSVTSPDAQIPTDTVLLSSGGSNEWELLLTDLSHHGTSLSFRMDLPLVGKRTVPLADDGANENDPRTKHYTFSPGVRVPKIKVGKRINVVIRGSAGIFDGASVPTDRRVEIWTDGKLRGSNDLPLIDPDGSRYAFRIAAKDFETPDLLKIGSASSGNIVQFEGAVDDLAIWKVALDDDAIAAIWRKGIGTPVGALLSDKDGDSMEDVWETSFGLDPTDGGDGSGDLDGDGLSNQQERLIGTHPNNPDTDGDGLLDIAESGMGDCFLVGQTVASPLHADTDRDGISDRLENPHLIVDADGKPVLTSSKRSLSVSHQDNRFVIRFPVERGVGYAIQYNTTLCPQWELIGEVLPTNDPFASFEETDEERRSRPNGFYRVVEFR